MIFVPSLFQETLLWFGIQFIFPLPCSGDFVTVWHKLYLSPLFSRRLCYDLVYILFPSSLVQKTLLRCGINYICSLSFPGDFVMIWYTVYFPLPCSGDFVTVWHKLYLLPLFSRRLCYDLVYSLFFPSFVQETLLRCGINYICPLSFQGDFFMIWLQTWFLYLQIGKQKPFESRATNGLWIQPGMIQNL